MGQFRASGRGEIRKRRPTDILGNDASNKHLNRVQVVPLTSKVDKLYPSEAYITVADRQNKAMADQLTTVSKKRLSERLGRLSQEDIRSVERVVALQLDLPSS